MSHLWEVKHSYYCEERGWNSTESETIYHYRSWQDFLSDRGDADLDYNLIFRWDWREEDENGELTFKGDVNYRNGKLYIHWMQQRRGFYHSTIIEVCRADEAAVIEYLRPRWGYLKALWSPINV